MVRVMAMDTAHIMAALATRITAMAREATMGRVADIDGAGAMADGHAVGAVIVGMAGGAMLVVEALVAEAATAGGVGELVCCN
jgi:hypothetical protein